MIIILITKNKTVAGVFKCVYTFTRIELNVFWDVNFPSSSSKSFIKPQIHSMAGPIFKTVCKTILQTRLK